MPLSETVLINIGIVLARSSEAWVALEPLQHFQLTPIFQYTSHIILHMR